ncbi:Fasciclin-like arabinogalactan protein 11 [Vitis vinifera]|uniref:Fasciclin-like arabinogalactan protein 11 n=1 Tax=Vitis vinifera TaxID=29760 RepID=A0A438H6R6_VITVI|nr:Fasciclin-like arabinogalactan protein 11 [Vitis vinifera]
MQLFTKFHVHFPSHPLNKSPNPFKLIQYNSSPFLYNNKTSAQSSSSGPIDIIAVLGKAGFTIFAPTDSAFSDLKTGTLNSFIDQQKLALTKFHIVHSFFTVPQFQTVSNPLHTEAGENSAEFPLNVIGNGTQVNVTTGLVNTTVGSTVYSDGQLAVYEIPQVDHLCCYSSDGTALPNHATIVVSIGVAVLAALRLCLYELVLIDE